ncbi:MAG: hypothetical protein H0X22_00395 [Acidimicrobiia bacterium]|nr:hypothetical protein [Acidimicrobiia bacterium]
MRQHGPDLTVVPVNTLPTGVVVVVGLDPASRVLSDRYDSLLDELQAGDPQVVPDHVLSRDDGGDQREAVATAIRGELAR